MAEELEEIWRHLTLMEEERDYVETDKAHEREEADVGQHWLVGKLLTNRSFNKEAMLVRCEWFGNY